MAMQEDISQSVYIVMTTWKIMATLAGVLFVILCTLCFIVANSERLPSKHHPSPHKNSSAIQMRRRINSPKIDGTSDNQQQLWDYFSQQLENGPGETAVDGFREKRFYPMHINIGCVRGLRCCEDPKCKPFCTLCYGGYGAPAATTPKCKDVNQNGICDDDEEKNTEDYDENDGEKAQANDDYDENDEEKAAPNDEDYDEKDEQKATPNDDYDESDGEKAAAANEGGDDKNNSTSIMGGKNETKSESERYELTYHIYEEYLPQSIERSEPQLPIIVQTIPHYSVSNFYNLNKHDFPHLSDHHYHRHHQIPQASPDYSYYGRPNNLINFQYQNSPPPIYHPQKEPQPPRLYYGDISKPYAPDELGYPIPPPTTHIINDHKHHNSYATTDDEAQNAYHRTQAPLVTPSSTFYYGNDKPSQQPFSHHYETQPLLKYHLIHQSFPAKKESHYQPYSDPKDLDDYLPSLAYYPGPPYLHQQEPQNSKIAEEHVSQKKKQKNGLLTGLVKRIFG